MVKTRITPWLSNKKKFVSRFESTHKHMGSETDHAETLEEEMQELPKERDNEKNHLQVWKRVAPEIIVYIRI